jgi:hypothetical protein
MPIDPTTPQCPASLPERLADIREALRRDVAARASHDRWTRLIERLFDSLLNMLIALSAGPADGAIAMAGLCTGQGQGQRGEPRRAAAFGRIQDGRVGADRSVDPGYCEAAWDHGDRTPPLPYQPELEPDAAAPLAEPAGPDAKSQPDPELFAPPVSAIVLPQKRFASCPKESPPERVEVRRGRLVHPIFVSGDRPFAARRDTGSGGSWSMPSAGIARICPLPQFFAAQAQTHSCVQFITMCNQMAQTLGSVLCSGEFSFP